MIGYIRSAVVPNINSISRKRFNVNGASLLSTLSDHGNSSSNPLIENYRSTWPDPEYQAPANILESLPKRTVPDSVLKFRMTASFGHGSSIFYPHIATHPADCKVRMQVSLNDLNLSKDESAIFLRMIGTRFNTGNKVVTLISDRFTNRLENKKYLIYLLEDLLVKTRELDMIKNSYLL